jgi:hypothetical protein
MRNPKIFSAWLGVAILCFGIELGAQQEATDHTLALQPGKASPPASIDDVAWISGRWVGEAFGGQCEEVWLPPRAGNMIGMYRLTKDEKTVFFELFSLSEVDGSVLMRLKHFHPDLKGWEEKDETIDFPLVAFTETDLFFDGLTFHKVDDDRITVYLAVGSKDGQSREETFFYKRVPEK